MTNTNHILGTPIPALLLFKRLAPTCAEELAGQMHRAGLRNSNDVVDALATGLRAFTRARGVSFASEFEQAWPGALEALKSCRSEEAWAGLLQQEATAPKATCARIVAGGAQMVRVLEAASETLQMRPRTATWFGVWIVTAAVIGHSGPLDADLSLEDLAECF